MKHIILAMLSVILAISCRETRSISSTEVASVKNGSDFQVSDAEADRIMQIILQKIQNGEDLSPNLTKIIQIVISRHGPDVPWKSLVVDPARGSQLQAKYTVYSKQYQKALDSYGFVEGCDGLLFTSLLVASGLKHNLSLAESSQEPGRWYRSAAQDCLPSGKSRSSISRDMLLGLSLGLWQTSDNSAVRRLLAFSQSHKGVLGDAVDAQELAGAATMSPSLLSLYSEIDFRLSGTNSDNRGYFPELGKSFAGFEAHLLALRLALKSSLYGGLLKPDYDLINGLAKTQPHNALFQALQHALSDGDGNPAADILLNTQYFPAEKLPGSVNRCEPYLWQRSEQSSDWQACPDKSEVFPAADFFWVYTLLTNSFRR